jgi:hypothetical protein
MSTLSHVCTQEGEGIIMIGAGERSYGEQKLDKIDGE